MKLCENMSFKLQYVLCNFTVHLSEAQVFYFAEALPYLRGLSAVMDGPCPHGIPWVYVVLYSRLPSSIRVDPDRPGSQACGSCFQGDGGFVVSKPRVHQSSRGPTARPALSSAAATRGTAPEADCRRQVLFGPPRLVDPAPQAPEPSLLGI